MRSMMRLIPVIGATALLVSSVVPAIAQSEEAELDLQARVDEYVGLMNGGMAAVTIRDGVVTTASAGIANDAGDPLTVDTPMLLGSPAAALTYVTALSLVDEGLLDLDAPLVDYLPDAPVAEGATVRDLLESRAGTPDVLETIFDSLSEDSDRIWTTDDMVALADPADVGTVGELVGTYTDTLVTIQLIEAVTDEDFATALDDRMVQPLGLMGTVHAEGDFEPPEGRAAGWNNWDGPESTYVTDDWDAARTFRPTYSTAADLASFLQALLDGRLVSPELLGETMWNEDVEGLGYGVLRSNEDLFPATGPLGASYFGMDGWAPAGSSAFFAVDPSAGDAVVVMTNNWDLADESGDLAKEVVQSWAPDPLASQPANEAQFEFRFVMGTFTCDVGQGFPFDLPPCEATETEMQLPLEMPYAMTGTFDGSGVQSGVLVQNLEDGTFTYTARGVFMGEVEGCGYGTMFFSIEDGAGYPDPDQQALVYTNGTAHILPGGTLPLAGSFDLVGVEAEHPDGTATVDVTGSYSCEGAGS
jgi:D-alanyl-D-alanine carboxypeptidase